MRNTLLGLAFLGLTQSVLGQTTPFSSISSGTNTTATMTVGNGASMAAAGTGTINATFTNIGAGAMLNPLATRLQTSGYAYPDFCPTVDGGVTANNTGCLTNALAALGTSFGVLEIPAIGATTSSNYYCLSLGTTWAAAQSRVRIWKGATLSCALPPADATHMIQDDNLAMDRIANQTYTTAVANGSLHRTPTFYFLQSLIKWFPVIQAGMPLPI